MKIRFGVGLGAGPSLSDFSRTVDRLEGAGIDSLWLSEQVYSDAVDPFIGMAHALSRTSRLKVGTSVAVLPGRHPVLVAKQLASLAALSPRRVLPVFGLQPARPGERELFPAPEGRRGALFDESLELLRASLRGRPPDSTVSSTRSDPRASGRCPPGPWTSGSGAARPRGCAGSGGTGTGGSAPSSRPRPPGAPGRRFRPRRRRRGGRSNPTTSGSASSSPRTAFRMTSP